MTESIRSYVLSMSLSSSSRLDLNILQCDHQQSPCTPNQDSLTLNILGSAVSNFIGISDGCISIEETKELA